MQWILMVSLLVLVSGYLVLQFFSSDIDLDEENSAVASDEPRQGDAGDQELKAA